MAVLKIDELNINSRRSTPFEEYFAAMRISRDRQLLRENRANSFYLFLMDILSTIDVFVEIYPNLSDVSSKYTTNGEDGSTADDGKRIPNSVRDDIERDYLLWLITIGAVIDDTTRQHASDYADNFVASTEEHLDDPWYISEDRAMWNAENEANLVTNYDELDEAIAQGFTTKTWKTMKDRKVREDHADVDEVSIPIEEPFLVGGDLMMYPMDESFDPDPSEVVNCRCSLEFS